MCYLEAKHYRVGLGNLVGVGDTGRWVEHCFGWTVQDILVGGTDSLCKAARSQVFAPGTPG